MIAAAAAAVFFGCIGFIAVQLSRAVCVGVRPAQNGPAPGRAPAIALVVASALIGGSLVTLGALPLQLGIAVIVVFALVACWCSDATCGIVPDLFTLVPLAMVLIFALAQRDWGTIGSAAAIFTPFAVAAFASGGYGMGWGDAKLVALTGAALGAPLALMTLAVACVAAVIAHKLSRAGQTPIAFAPYIAAATGIALPIGLAH